MGKPIKVSIDLNTLLDAYRDSHSAFKKSDKNGRYYVTVNVWFNDQPNKMGNDISLQLKSAKGAPADEKKVYIGGGKSEVFPHAGGSTASAGTAGSSSAGAPPGWGGEGGDLPF